MAKTHQSARPKRTLFKVSALHRTTEEKTPQLSQPKRTRDDPRHPRVPRGPHLGPPGPPVIPPTHRIIGITTVKHTFLKVSLFRHKATKGSTERPQGHPRPPKGGARCPKAPPRCPNGGYFGCLLGTLLMNISCVGSIGSPKRAPGVAIHGLQLLKVEKMISFWVPKSILNQ